MATLSDLIRAHTDLDADDAEHLQRLVADWGVLADFCFADLLLYGRQGPGDWVVLAQVRPYTAQTLYVTDWVGSFADDSEDELLDTVWASGTQDESELLVDGLPNVSRIRAIPVRRNGKIIAILSREWNERVGRILGDLEHTYLGIFERFVGMIAGGTYPYESRQVRTPATPRVGDGVLVLDADARVQYASPNAVSVLHRVGIATNAIGLKLAEVGFNDSAVRTAFDNLEPVIDEIDQTPEISLATRVIPLQEGPVLTGGVVLLRDISEVRRRDRMIMSRDATIQEIHHRVKNNLQTISSLLRLQARRLTSVEAKEAIAESVRRIRTIALVHETLSREPGEDVPFTEIVRPLARLAEESLQSPDRPVSFEVRGDGGRLPAAIATPLSVVLTELLQNAVDHAIRSGPEAGRVVVDLSHSTDSVIVRVIDDGGGLPDGFSLDQATGLGLSIVRTLVTTELAGSIIMVTVDAAALADFGIPNGVGGTLVTLTVPRGLPA